MVKKKKTIFDRLEEIASFKVEHERSHGQIGRCTICSYNRGQVSMAKGLLDKFQEKKK